MIIKCTNCGTLSNYRKFGKLETNGDRMMQMYKCACGRARHQVFLKVDGSAVWMDDKMISTTFKKKLDKSANL